LKLIWLGLLFEIFLLILIKPFTVDFEFVSILAVSVHIFFTMVVLFVQKSKFKLIFSAAFFGRIMFMLWDLNARQIFQLPNSGGDSVGFYNSAILVSENISLLNENIYGAMYSKMIGLLFYWIGPLQMFAYYINVLLGLSVVLVIYKILNMLEVNYKITKLILLLVAFFPNSMVMSAIFLREIIITFFVTYSLYYFIKWFKKGFKINMVLSILTLGIASLFHSGVVGIFLGYAFVFLFYIKEKNKYQFNVKSVMVFLGLVSFSFLVYTQFSAIFLAKFGNVESMNDIYSRANMSLGGSAYLTNITINNPIQLVIYGPIKTFYFLTSPLPMDWRGFMDIFTFLFDSTLYLSTFIYFVLNRRKFKERKVLITSLALILVSVSVVFGIGVFNAGTAVRHRQKIISIFLILFALMMDEKSKYNFKPFNKWTKSEKI